MTFSFRSPETPLTEDQLLLRKRVLAQAEASPRSFSMGDWEARSDSCGTTRCLAGWAQFLARGTVVVSHFDAEFDYVKYDAVELLGLTEDEYFGAEDDGFRYRSELFFTDNFNALRRLRRLAGEA